MDHVVPLGLWGRLTL